MLTPPTPLPTPTPPKFSKWWLGLVPVIVLAVIVIVIGRSVFYSAPEPLRFIDDVTLPTAHPIPTAAPAPSPSPTSTQQPASLTFMLAGDIMLDRSVADLYFFKNGGRFTDVLTKFDLDVFKGVDLGLVNLEGPISAQTVSNDTTSTNLIFNFPPEALEVAKALGVNAVSLANNHSANAGKAGLANTREVLTAAGIAPIGGPADSDIDKTFSVTGKGLILHVIGVHSLGGSPDLFALIASLKKSPTDRVLVFSHWGAEYQTAHGATQEELAHDWVDAGADLVVGAHPHVVQDAEVYKGVPIIYSLGNFIFDQWFSTETERGMLLGGEFTNDGLRLYGLPIGINKARPYLLAGTEKATRLERIYQPLTEYMRDSEQGQEVFVPRPVL